MRNSLIVKTLLIAIVSLTFSIGSFADTYTYTFAAQAWSAYGTQTLSAVSWTAAGTSGAYFGYDTNNSPSKGQQFGSSANPATTLSLTTPGVAGTISSVKVNTSGASSVAATVSVAVGSTPFTLGGSAAPAITASAADYTFTGSASGNVVISWAQTSSKALYIRSIDIMYTTVPTTVPVVTNTAPTGTYGTPFTFNIAATNMPTSYAIASGTLPAGLSLNTTSGLISGIPSAVGASTITVTATNTVGTSAAATLSFNIAKANQTITFGALDIKTNQDVPFLLTATSSSGLAVAYQSSKITVATVAGSTVSIVGIGSAVITASQAGNDNYNTAVSVDQTLDVIQYVAPTIAITEVTTPDFTTAVGNTSNQTVAVSGVNLTTNISLTLSGANANQFTISQPSVLQVGGLAANTFVTVNYTPTSAGTHTAVLTFSTANAIDVTSPLTGVSTTTTELIIPQVLIDMYAANGTIRLNAQAGEIIEIYNAVGQKLLTRKAIDGVNFISVSAHGVLIVRVGNKVGKVIL